VVDKTCSPNLGVPLVFEANSISTARDMTWDMALAVAWTRHAYNLRHQLFQMSQVYISLSLTWIQNVWIFSDICGPFTQFKGFLVGLQKDVRIQKTRPSKTYTRKSGNLLQHHLEYHSPQPVKTFWPKNR
jgi:hypothetical protein